MKLIDADSLPRHGNRGGLVNWYDIEKAPTVELTRCKDCKHYADECCDRYADETLGYVHSTQEYGYCWVAERKEE